ncbi:MAG: hypothetical protein PHX05_03930, partial [Acidobacteriota bacterium]|nr:hypothetical protein [Acidobacteriota bacterium]
MRKKFLLKRILALPLLTLFLAALALAQVPAVGGEAAASGDTAWEEELLRERVLKDIEFKTSVTSPMAGRERLIVPAAARTFILVSGGEVKTSELHAKGAAFALLFRDGQWYWDEGAPGV